MNFQDVLQDAISCPRTPPPLLQARPWPGPMFAGNATLIFSLPKRLNFLLIRRKHIDNAYTHLPDFSKKEVQEILVYAIIYSMIVEMKNNYTKNRIGFFGPNRKFTFGGKALTEGAKHLINKYGDCTINKTSIGEFYGWMKNIKNPEELDKNIRREIRDEISKRLEKVNYWDYIPLPKRHKNRRLKSYF